MKKNLKMLVAVFALSLAAVFTSVVPAQAAQAAPSVSKNSLNEWRFKLYSHEAIYEKQTASVGLATEFYGANVTFKSSNTKIATVDKLGNVTGKKAGKATITATDGTHTSKCTVTVKSLKKAKKNELVLNYAANTKYFEDAIMEYGKQYMIKNLNGSPVKSLKRVKGNCKISGTKVTLLPKEDNETVVVCITLKSGKKYNVRWSCTSSKEREEAIEIAKSGMVEYGVTKNSSDLEKAMFIYNFCGDKIEQFGPDAAKYKAPGNYYGIRKGYGDCDVCAEAVCLLADVVGLPAVKVHTSDDTHVYNGVRVDGEWYLMDTMQCQSWAFALGNGHFLNSYARELEIDESMAFTVHPNSAADVVFDSTLYDGRMWPEYRQKYDESNPMEWWDDPNLDW